MATGMRLSNGGVTCLYELNRRPDEILPDVRSGGVQCEVSDGLCDYKGIRFSIHGCRTYGDVFKAFFDKAALDIPTWEVEAVEVVLHFYSYNDGSGEAAALVDFE